MRNPRIVIGVLTLVALACRLPLTYGSSIWADEAMALNVVAIPSISGMIEFLRFHESHPPLFYLMLRAWRGIAGTGDVAAFSLMLFISTLLVPATYAVARSFMTTRASIVAALMVAISPALAEHSTQIRPYGLLHLLVLVSCWLLAEAIERRGWKRWSAFALVTALMLYTHNWTWVVFGGQVFAGAVALMRLSPVDRKPRAVEFSLAVLVVVALYLPWFSTLVFQAAHAGHTGLQLDTVSGLLAFFLFALVSIPDYLLLGLHPRSSYSLVLIAALVAGSVVAVTAVSKRVARRLPGLLQNGGERSTRRSNPLEMFLITMIVALVAAVVLSPWTTLFIQRCVAMLTPLALICLAAVFDKMLIRPAGSVVAPLGIGLLAFVLTLEAAAIFALVSTTRSNAREVAGAVRASMQPDDLLIIAPEWFAPAFNHYFPPSIEQHDHPQAGRSGLVDFTSVQRRSLDSAATGRLARAIAEARSSGRRVWLVSERTYLRYVDEVLPAITNDAERARFASVRRAEEARDLLTAAYGPPDSAHFVHGRVSRYEELLPLLFEPFPGARRSF